MLNIQTLFYRIGASNQEFKQKMSESKSKLQEFDDRTKDNIRTLRNWSLAAGAAAGAVVYAINRTVRETSQTANEVKKLSEQTGVAVENMQALGYVAKQNESSMETLGSSLVRMTRRLQAAHQGNETYKKSYASMGVQIHDTNGKLRSTEEIFLDLADAFSLSNDENQKAQVAFDVLGQSGYDLIPMLNQGRQEILRLANEANELGIVLTKENIDKFAKYDETMVKWRKTTEGIKMQISSAIVPAFTLLAQKAGDGLKNFLAWARENPKLVTKALVLGTALVTLGLALGGVATAITLVSKGALVMRSLFGLLTNPIVWLIALVALLYTAWDEDWGGIQGIVENVVTAIQNKIGEFKKWWENSPVAKVLKNLWADLKQIWENDETSLVEKIGQTLWAITKAFVVEIGGIVWEWLGKKYDSLLDWWNGYTEEMFDEDGNLIGTKEHLGMKQRIMVLLDAYFGENSLYKAIKKGFEEGDWSDFWGIAADNWAKGVLLYIALDSTVKGITAVLSAIKTGLGIVGAGASLGVPGALGAVTVLIQLAEARAKGEGYKEFAENVIFAGLAAVLVGLGVNPMLGALAFTVFMNLKLGETFFESLRGLGEKWDDFFKGLTGYTPDELGELIYDKMYGVRTEPQEFSGSETDNFLYTMKRGENLVDIWEKHYSEGYPDIKDFGQAIMDLNPEDRTPFAHYTGKVIKLPPMDASDFIEEVQKTQEELKTLDDLLDSIYRAEGGTAASVPYGMTTWKDKPVKYKSDIDQARFEDLSEGLEERSEPYWRAAAQTTVESYWGHFQNKFPEVASKHFDEVTPEMQQLFITYLGAWFSPPSASGVNINWVPNVLKFMDFDELSAGFREGFGNVLDSVEQAVYDKAADHETAANFLAKIYADRLVGQSPPPKGPLKNLTIGAQAAMAGWVAGAEKGLEDGIPIVTRVLNKIKELFSSLGDSVLDGLRKRFPEFMETLENLIDFDGGFADLGLDEALKQIEDIINGTNEAESAAKAWTESLASGLADAIVFGEGLKGKLNSLRDVFDNFAGMLASQWLEQKIIGPILGLGSKDTTGNDAMGWFANLLSKMPIFHDGGLILSPAAYYHSGGFIGELKSDEVPIIAQTGERILSRTQNDQFEQMLANQGGGSDGLRIDKIEIKANDAKSFADMLVNNPDAITYIVGNNIMNNGELRKILKGIG